ncbi:class I SAM-dependent methyltransferase [Psychromarinibacter halotolerans]|uniref:Class I SAM-dependent methyltransferase n=1 Tax=Psychromarinibacter halotolerans TaxID=1775175 RepID=A0ABV7GNQ6_9RHOB|nr:SAM-dependent methyltransferase [Psychromarinibacter halotolerans]MDF0597831.1 SAM-dependent methyltransferase [Psychromarinibacter halotolerans]
MTPLAGLLARRIAATGPLTVADYMADCLLHPEHGYYTTRDPFGVAGDFTTAPEISQMFGEVLGLSLAQAWLDQGAPSSFLLAELGPGRGTLMADILRATARVPGFHDAARPVLVEASPVLRDKQRETLAGHAVQWCDDVDGLPDGPLFLVANEFLDALPIRQFLRDGSGWRERLVTVADGALAFGLGAVTPLGPLAYRMADTADGDMVETCAPAAAVAESLAPRIAAQGGAAIFIDYGDWRSKGDTLQALRAHEPDDPLSHPGEADLTAHVDFEAFARAATGAAKGVAASAMVAQGMFLERLGITQRAQQLAGGLTGAPLDQLVAAHRRLTHPQEMGSLFKVLAIHPDRTAPPPGLER